jgi:protease-4
MSNASDPRRPLDVLPVYSVPPRRSSFGCGRVFFILLLLVSLGANVVLLLLVLVASGSSVFGDTDGMVYERHYAGKTLSTEKVAVVKIDGVLMEGMNGFMHREIDHAARDEAVKAVVLRINSPGGTITASDDLHKRLTELRDGNPIKKTHPKPLIVSMGSITASGGYYIAMVSSKLMAERTTITGSIGVYAALPNITELGKKVGFSMNIIKAGEVKDSGSPFKEMTPKERDVWQAMVDHSYLQFLHIVEEGRPKLKGKLQEDLAIDETLPIRDAKEHEQHVHYTRYRADGGIFVAESAKKYGLIDGIGYLDDAIAEARKTAGLSADSKVVIYQRPLTLMGALLGETESRASESALDPARISEAAVPRLWYLAPQSELAGILATTGRKGE